VTALGPTETAPDSGQTFRRAILEPAATTTIDPALLGRDLRLIVEGDTTGEPVLVVPVAAITNGPDGGPRVERVGGESVPVRVGATADGYTEVEGDLAPGDEVVVGR
jgi:hypothetical protein